jgi:hypothetical protein
MGISSAPVTYHIADAHNDRAGLPVCGLLLESGDKLVSFEEISAPDGRWFNCRACGDILGMVKHVEPGSVPAPDPASLA